MYMSHNHEGQPQVLPPLSRPLSALRNPRQVSHLVDLNIMGRSSAFSHYTDVKLIFSKVEGLVQSMAAGVPRPSKRTAMGG